MSSTTLEIPMPKNSIKTRQFLHENNICYVLGHVTVCPETNKKTIKKHPPKDWKKWNWELCMEYNGVQDKKCKTMYINLASSKFMVVDIDETDPDRCEELHLKYSPHKLSHTISIRNKTPHIWFEKQPDDPGKNKMGLELKVDAIYHVLFEDIHSIMYNGHSGCDEFDWEGFGIEAPAQEDKVPLTAPCGTRNNNKLIALLDIINVKHWTNYGDWRNLLWAIKHEFKDEAPAIAIKYSKISPAYDCEDSVIDMLDKCDGQGRCTAGTIHHFAKKSDARAYANIVCNEFTGTQHSLATLFLNAFGKNLIKNKNDDLYIYYDKIWRPAKQNSFGLLRTIAPEIIAPIILDEFRSLSKKAEVLSIGDEKLDAIEKRMKLLRSAQALIETDCGRIRICNIVKDELCKRPATDIEFDIGSEQHLNIHFKNGVFNLKHRTFRQRTEEDYITQTLDWNYKKERNEDNIKIVNDFFLKVQPDKEQRDFQIAWLAHCLHGDVSMEKFKMNIGTASNGKTVEFTIHKTCFPLYSHKFSSKIFNKNYDKFHKDMYPLTYLPKRFVYIEELESDSKMNVDLIKDVVSGDNVCVTIMYGNTVNVKCQAKLNFCSNHDPNADSDGGIVRRGLLQNYNSHFDSYDSDDFVNHKYIKEEGFSKQFEKDDMKLAYFHTLMDNYTDKLYTPKSLSDGFNDTLNEYDEFKNMFENDFTRCDAHSVSKAELITHLKENKLNCGWRHVRGEMKKLNVEYQSQTRGGQYRISKGVFMNIKINDIDESDPDE